MNKTFAVQCASNSGIHRYISLCVCISHREAVTQDDDAAFIVQFHLKANQLLKAVVSRYTMNRRMNSIPYILTDMLTLITRLHAVPTNFPRDVRMSEKSNESLNHRCLKERSKKSTAARLG